MIKRLALLFLALLFPIGAALGVGYFALGGMLPVARKNTTPIAAPMITKPAIPDNVPETLEEARAMATRRLEHLQVLSQEEWDAERVSILHRNPPATIEAAIERTQKRIDDLANMLPVEWPAELKRLQDRAAAQAQ
jgi:hypothetical protein